MNRTTHGFAEGSIIFKDKITARPGPEAAPSPKPQRRSLGPRIVPEDVRHPSALDGRSRDELASPATVADVLTCLDSAVAIRSDIDRPLKLRLARLESDNGELKAELATAQTAVVKLETMAKALRSAIPDPELTKLGIAAEVKVQVAAQVKAYFEELSKRAADRRAAQKAEKQ
jgi:hypothetical protein